MLYAWLSLQAQWLRVLPLIPQLKVDATSTSKPGTATPSLDPSGHSNAPLTIQWGPCMHIDNSTQAFNALVVPLDHANSPLPGQSNASNTVTIGMARLRATLPLSPGTVRQSLILNPGGPGGIASYSVQRQFELESAISTDGSHVRGTISPAVRERYDLIGIDPRGVGLSQAVRCNETLGEERPDIVIRTQEAYDELANWNRRYAESCSGMSGDLVRFVDSVSVARDFELVSRVSIPFLGPN